MTSDWKCTWCGALSSSDFYAPAVCFHCGQQGGLVQIGLKKNAVPWDGQDNPYDELVSYLSDAVYVQPTSIITRRSTIKRVMDSKGGTLSMRVKRWSEYTHSIVKRRHVTSRS